MSLDEMIAYLEGLIPQMDVVKKGDFVLAKHPNVFVDFVNGSISVVRDLYELFKEKTGESLPEVEYYIGMAEGRASLLRKVRHGDIVRVQDHNLVIDCLKPLEVAVQIMLANL